MTPSTLERNILLTALVLLAVLFGVQHGRARLQIRNLAARQDSTLASVGEYFAIRDSVLSAGGSVVGGFVRSAAGDTIALSDVAQSRRLLYFYRNDCPACTILARLISALPPEQANRVARIAYSPAADDDPDYAPNGFGWLPGASQSMGKLTYGVPTIFVVRNDGRIESAAHANLNRVAALFELHHLLSVQSVDSIVQLEMVASNIERGVRP